MSISDTTLSTDVFDTIKNVIVAAAPKITNSTTLKTKTASIVAAHNDKKTYVPQIVIVPAKVDEGDWTYGSTEGKKLINVGVECYYKNTLGIDQLSDQVKVAIKNALADSTIVGMELEIVTEDYAYVDQNQNKFQLKTLTFTFNRE